MELATTRPNLLYSEWPVLVGELRIEISLHRVGAWKSEYAVPLETVWDLDCLSSDVVEPGVMGETLEAVDEHEDMLARVAIEAW